MSRELPEIGLHFRLENTAIWDRRIFEGICLGNGCPLTFAERVSFELESRRERKCTVRQVADWEHLKAACREVGVRVTQIPPRA